VNACAHEGEAAVRIGPITEGDYEAALPLIAEYQRFYGVATPDLERNRTFFRRFLAPSDDGMLLGAWEGELLVGFTCLYWTYSSITAREIVLLADLLVQESARGRGIGERLIDAAVAVARERGAGHIEWVTHVDNRRAQRLYDRIPSAHRDTWLGYEIPLEGS